MTPVNGIGANGKVHFEGQLGPSAHVQIARIMGLRATPAARERLQAYIKSGKNPTHLITLFRRTCSALHLESGKFTEQAFVERFANWRIEGLNNEISPNSPDYQIRFLLERVFNCGLAYHEESGLAMVTSEEWDDIAKGEAEGYRLACPFAAKPLIVAPPISAPLPRITLTRRVVALVKHLAQPLAEKRSYSEQLRQRILFHVTEGHFRSAAFLLFRDKTAREILDFVRKENLAERITSPEWALLLRIGMRPDIDYSAPSEEIAIGFLLAEAHPVISAYFIEDQAKSDPHSAARILGLVGQATRSVEVAEVGDLTSDVERSLAGYVLSAMLIRGQEKLANRVVSSGLLDGVFRETYIRVLNELHSDFDESIATIGQYEGSSLFQKGIAAFRQVEDKSGTAMVKVKPGAYGWGGEELLSPRLFYRNLARKILEGGGADLAWEMMTCGRPAVEAFNDLNSALDPASFGRLLGTRGRDEIARFVVEVLAGGEEYIEALAYVLRDTHEDIRDVAGLFEYLIEADGEIAGSREAAYAILYYAATAIENPSMSPLLDRYQEILVQIEQDKESAGWFNADVFLKEGRFLPTDPPSKIRDDRLKFYFDLLKDTARPEEDRIYAARMLGRMGAIEYLNAFQKKLAKDLKNKDISIISMTIAKIYLDICEELDPTKEGQKKLHYRATRFLKAFRDKLEDLFATDPVISGQILVGRDELERSEAARGKTLARAEIARKIEVGRLVEQIHDLFYRAWAWFYIAMAEDAAGKPEETVVEYFKKALEQYRFSKYNRMIESTKIDSTLISILARALLQSKISQDRQIELFRQILNDLSKGKTGDYVDLVMTIHIIAQAPFEKGQKAELLKQAIVSTRKHESRNLLVLAHALLAISYTELDPDNAFELLRQIIVKIETAMFDYPHCSVRDPDMDERIVPILAARAVIQLSPLLSENEKVKLFKLLVRTGVIELELNKPSKIMEDLAKVIASAGLSNSSLIYIFEEILLNATRFPDTVRKIRKLIGIAKAMALAGLPKETAFNTIITALDFAETIDDPWYKEQSLQEAAIATKEIGHDDEYTKSILLNALEAARTCGGWAQNLALSSLAKCMAELGFPELAHPTALQISDQAEKERALASLGPNINPSQKTEPHNMPKDIDEIVLPKAPFLGDRWSFDDINTKDVLHINNDLRTIKEFARYLYYGSNQLNHSKLLACLAGQVARYTQPTSDGLFLEQKVMAWLHTRIYAILGMAEE